MPLRRRLSPAHRELTIGLDSFWASHQALTMWTWAANRLQKTFFSQGPAQSSVQVLHRGAKGELALDSKAVALRRYTDVHSLAL